MSAMTLPPIDPATEALKIADFIKATVDKAKKKQVVIALSGGIDSTLSFLLAIQAVGADQVLPIHLPSNHSNPIHTKDVHTLLTSVNFPQERLTTIPIGSIIQKTWRTINRNTSTQHTAKSMPDRKKENATVAQINHLRIANLSARIRMQVIFDHAKRHDALVVGTENYSEHLLGYFTRFGDEASDMEPIRHLYKTQVIELAKYLKAPISILTKSPSADLWVGQSDEKEMGFSYAQADPILIQVDQGKTIEHIVAQGFDQSLVEKVLGQVHQNYFKLEVPYVIQNHTQS